MSRAEQIRAFCREHGRITEAQLCGLDPSLTQRRAGNVLSQLRRWGVLADAPERGAYRLANGAEASGKVWALEAQLDAARDAFTPAELAAADGYVHVAVATLKARLSALGTELLAAELGKPINALYVLEHYRDLFWPPEDVDELERDEPSEAMVQS